ncbi:MAG TPA: cation:proton antiporter subunit C [Synergistales bacterium]|nr:cation:proton antiporter subunit C [Synergistales bacterium]
MELLTVLRILLLGLVAIGLAGLLIKRNLIMKIIAMDIMNTGVISLFVLAAWRRGRAPLTVDLSNPMASADPVPQAVIVTAIVIGFSILSLLVVYVMDLSRYFHTLDTERIQEKWHR